MLATSNEFESFDAMMDAMETEFKVSLTDDLSKNAQGTYTISGNTITFTDTTEEDGSEDIICTISEFTATTLKFTDQDEASTILTKNQ